MNPSPELELVQYTDPYCTWCWGAEPILRKVEEVYQDQVRMSYKMGGLVADIKTFFDTGNRIGGAKWYQQVADHWLDASNRHGMPVDEKVFFDIADSNFSTHPANIAYKAAQLQDPTLANKFLRRLREATAAERRIIQDLEVQKELAVEIGLNGERLLADIENGRASAAFAEDLSECRRHGIRGFPAFLIRNLRTGKELLLNGYRQFDEISAALRMLGGNSVAPDFPETDKETILNFSARTMNTAPREIAEVFDLKAAETDRILDSLVADGALHRRPVGNGLFYSAL